MRKSLNNPGESGDRRRWDALVEQAFIPLMVGVCAVVFALQEWLFAAFGSRPHPGIATVVAVIVLCFVVPRIRRGLRFVDRLGKGVQGGEDRRGGSRRAEGVWIPRLPRS
jgi:hypothetical protein